MAYGDACACARRNFGPSPAGDAGSEAWEEWWKRTGPAEPAERAAAAEDAYEVTVEELIRTNPTTLASTAALLAFWRVSNLIGWGAMRWHQPVLQNMVDAMKRMAAEEVRS